MVIILLLMATILLPNCATACDSLVDDLLTQPGSSKNMRIGIIGAGAAGLSAAYYLKQSGYNNVTILERDSRVGGKCHTVTLGGGVRAWCYFNT